MVASSCCYFRRLPQLAFRVAMRWRFAQCCLHAERRHQRPAYISICINNRDISQRKPSCLCSYKFGDYGAMTVAKPTRQYTVSPARSFKKILYFPGAYEVAFLLFMPITRIICTASQTQLNRNNAVCTSVGLRTLRNDF